MNVVRVILSSAVSFCSDTADVECFVLTRREFIHQNFCAGGEKGIMLTKQPGVRAADAVGAMVAIIDTLDVLRK